YISGEIISYRAFYREPAQSSKAIWSRVLYVELIMPNGTALEQGKVPIDSGGISGTILIPEGISSGTHYLKAYTRWMRNCGQENYVYTSVRIYDSFNESVLPVDSTGWNGAGPEALINQADSHSDALLKCSLNGTSFQTRQEVMAELLWMFPNAPADLTISVARAGLHGNQEYFRPGCPLNAENEYDFLPETKGLSLTGLAVSAENRTPAPYATIYVSMLGENREFFCNYSDSAGRFFFSFPDYSGFRDLFVSTYHSDYGDLELLIDRDFSSDVPQLPSYPVEINDSLTMAITEMSVNSQVSQQYYPQAFVEMEIDSAGGMLFYGRPMATIDFDDFIKLPRLEEYFVEVVPQVSVRKNRGVNHFEVLGPHPDLAIYPPLVMIDGVAIFDIEAVLAVSPRLIDRIEIVNAPYIRGNVTFGGIISLISKNNDLGYIDLPSSGLLVNYQMLDQPLDRSQTAAISDARYPDVRNTLYWNPGLILNPDEREFIKFQTSDLKGEYEILIRGSDTAGRFVEKRIPFRVE
ncbi:MAG: hypothetical protein KAT15_10540, partial [Bacteroidales bacterium]|nr:hypothetical protein [Bacteroidales bacterium]